MTDPGVRARLERIFRAGLAAADPLPAQRRALARLDGVQNLRVLAVGKAAATMARGLEQDVGERIVAGLAITKTGHGVPLARFRLREAGHPVPDARSEQAGREALAFVAAATAQDVLLVLLSGGASSLMACPAEGLTQEDLAATTWALLGSGAPIEELNVVRKHLSAVSGGLLARRAAAGRVLVLAVSDVAGDRLDVIGSGPCAPDPSRFEDALEVLGRRAIADVVPAPVRVRLEAGARGDLPETPDADDPVFGRVEHVVLASNRTALEAARRAALAEGLETRVLSEELAGEARVAAERLVALAGTLRPARPTCLLAGGETTVTLDGASGGQGGRCQELALAAALALDGVPDRALLAAGTDGSDGPTDAAGAYADGATLARARARGLDAAAALRAHDSHRFFAGEGGLVRTGPTGTNVRDLVFLEAR